MAQVKTARGIEELPDEVLLEVFTYLSSTDIVACSRVTRRWQAITRSRRLWRNLHYDAKGESAVKEALQITKLACGFHSLSLQLCTRTSVELNDGKAVLSLSQQAWEVFGATLEEAVERLASGLVRLLVKGHECHLVQLRRLMVAAPFRRLTSFQALSQCGGAVDDATLCALCEHCPLLETLVLEGCGLHRLTAAGGLAELYRLKKLHTLHLDRKVSPEDVKAMDTCYRRRVEDEEPCTCEAHDLSFLSRCHALVTLYLSPCNEFTCGLPELRTLTLKSEHVQANGGRLETAIRVLPQLRDLSLIGYWRLDDEHLRRLRAAGPVYSLFWLEQLHMEGVLVKIKFDRS